MVFIPLAATPQGYKQGNSKPYRAPIGLCTPMTPDLGPNAVRLDIDWSLYGITAATPFALIDYDLVAQQVERPLDLMKSVYIDNTAGYTPVYIIFPDTQHVVLCPPHSITWQPIMTGGTRCRIYSAGFFYTLLPKISVHFTNVSQAGYTVTFPAASVNGAFVGCSIATVAATTAFAATFAAAANFPAQPNRIAVVAIATQSSVLGGAPDTINTVLIGGVVGIPLAQLTVIDVNTNKITLGLFYAVVPTGGSLNVSFNTTGNCTSRAVALWLLYNAISTVPYLTNTATINSGNNIVPSVVNAAPFVTVGGYCLLATLGRPISNTPPVGQNWSQKAFVLGQFNIGNLAFSIAEIDGGGRDDFVSINVQNTEIIALAAWD